MSLYRTDRAAILINFNFQDSSASTPPAYTKTDQRTNPGIVRNTTPGICLTFAVKVTNPGNEPTLNPGLDRCRMHTTSGWSPSLLDDL